MPIKKSKMKILFYIFILIITIGCNKEKQDQVNSSFNLNVHNYDMYTSSKVIFLRDKLYGYIYENVELNQIVDLFHNVDTLSWCEFHHSLIRNFCIFEGYFIENLTFYQTEIIDICADSLNVESLKYETCNLNTNSLIITSPSLESLSIIDCNIENLKLGFLPKLRTLNIAYNSNLNKIDWVDSIPENLEQINIAGTNIKESDLYLFPKLRKITTDSILFNMDNSYKRIRNEIEVTITFSHMPKW
jgi:hypothetical protein